MILMPLFAWPGVDVHAEGSDIAPIADVRLPGDLHRDPQNVSPITGSCSRIQRQRLIRIP